MKTLHVPTFDEFNDYKFIKFQSVKIKNNPDNKDYNKVTRLLPGFCVGYCPELYTIGETEKPIEVTSFYDTRQKSVKKLEGYYIILDKTKYYEKV